MLTAAPSVANRFARFSPLFVPLLVLTLLIPTHICAQPTATVKRQAAAQFQKAEQQRAILNVKPLAKRTLADYRQVVSSYRRVYLITPRASDVPEAMLAISQLYAEMGDRFGKNYYQSAVEAYRMVLRDYPNSRFAPDAMLVCAKIQRDQLADYGGASKTYQDFLKKYPRSPRKREAQEGIAELAMLQNVPAAAPERTSRQTASSSGTALPSDESIDAASTAARAPGGSVGVSRLRRIRSSITEEGTRVTIDLENVVPYDSGRLANPDRIFFDLRQARILSDVARENVNVDGDLLTAVRVAQNHGVVRVVLDVSGVKDYVVSTSDNPPQLSIDLFRRKLSAAAAKAARATHNLGSSQASGSTLAAQSEGPFVRPTDVKSGAKTPDVQPSGPSPVDSIKLAKSGTSSAAIAVSAQPTHDGQSTLTRALGLKIGRIVIDAGHGGHDTGTIGPTGLMEKDLCLDVALRLGKIIKQRLPGAEVVYTRADDSFIPLEERTAIANEAHADLFISIHANSSQDHGARGIETYYLNLKGSPDAMEVAARENAVSQVGIHDLEDLIKKIARNEKIDESKEFAEDIQTSLAQRVQKTNKTVKDRGVRKAPFVVLIGAEMPSILTEISFLSNPADEQLLKQPENRQRVAEGLFQGVANYLQSLNSVTVNQSIAPSEPPSQHSKSSAKLEQGRNEQ